MSTPTLVWGMPLIGVYIRRTLCSVRRDVRIYPSLSTSLLYSGGPTVAECFCDQTLLTPSVDNLDNSSSSLQLKPLIAMEKGEGGGQRRLFLSFWVRLRGNAGEGEMRSCVCFCVCLCGCVCVHSEMENCYSVFKWSLSIHFHHKSNNPEFLSPCSPLAIHLLHLFFPLSSTSSRTVFPSFPPLPLSHTSFLHFQWN